jgi:hypothetical protein
MKKSKTKKPRPEGRFLCKCECGGNVRYVMSFGRKWSWCDTCTPVEIVVLPRDGNAKS